MKHPLSILAVAALGLSACASNQVIVDTKGVDMSRYEQDRKECEAYVEQLASGGQIAKSTGLGAAIGAVVGGAAGAIFGDSTAAARGAAVGGITGGARGGHRSRGKGDDRRWRDTGVANPEPGRAQPPLASGEGATEGVGLDRRDRARREAAGREAAERLECRRARKREAGANAVTQVIPAGLYPEAVASSYP